MSAQIVIVLKLVRINLFCSTFHSNCYDEKIKHNSKVYVTKKTALQKDFWT